ncbi:HET domain-containing protein [Diaporthe eres]|nr:HET domain-containing protein [Diaporthe eres]
MRIWIFVGAGTFVAEEIIPYLSSKSLPLQLGLQRDPVPDQPDFGAQGVLKPLEMCRQRQPRDTRDKSYAIFGMVKAVQSMRPASDTVHSIIMDPDYTKPVVYVYRTLTQQLIETTESLDVLGVCPQSTRGGLPSWVTDWSITGSFAAPLTRDSLDRPRRTHATRGTVGRFRFPLDAVTLVLPGHEVTKVKSVSAVLRRVHYKVGAREVDFSEIVEMNEFWLQLKDSFKEVFEQISDMFHAMIDWVHTLLEWERFAARTSPQNPGVEDAESYDKDPAETEAKYHEWLEVAENVRKIEKRFGSISSKISPTAYTMQSKVWSNGFPKFTPYMECAVERRFAWCENEWLCLLPAGTLKDDRIVLAEGGRVPLVLRPDGDGYYMYVGEAYVHGIMDGEAFRPELLKWGNSLQL